MGVEEAPPAMATRIFVGGLGGSVSADDVRKTFSSLGQVIDVDIVRTKGRSFAYMDFHPTSEHSLSKLFSLYNGCVWKGGRIKLERAKEHYTLRLRREWQEDAQLASISTSGTLAVDKEVVHLEKSNHMQNNEQDDIRLFFPKLRKVKQLPFRGSGKHKYSFQRIECPALPIHICSCEEHSDPPNSVSGKDVSGSGNDSGGVNEDEVHLMNSIMKKLLEKENDSKAAPNLTDQAEKIGNSVESFGAVVLSENDADSSDDNLIVNMVTGRSDRMTVLRREEDIISGKQESKGDGPKTSNDKITNKMQGSRERKNTLPSKKRKSLTIEVTDRGANVDNNRGKKQRLRSADPKSNVVQSTTRTLSQKSSWRKLVDDNEASEFNIAGLVQGSSSTREDGPASDSLHVFDAPESKLPDIVRHENLESQPEEMLVRTQPQATKPNEAVGKLAVGASWLQKSSWTALVGNQSSSSFSISQIISTINPENVVSAEPLSVDVSKSFNRSKSDLNQNKSKPVEDRFRGFGLQGKPSVLSVNSEVATLDQNKQLIGSEGAAQGISNTVSNTVVDKNEESGPIVAEQCQTAAKEASQLGPGFGETCFFMRNDDSMKEWARIKASLTGSLKKKNNAK